MDTLDVIEPVQLTRDGAVVVPVLFRSPAKKEGPPAPRRQKEEKWASDLKPMDLRCLLAILETSVIPQLLRGYSPAVSVPLPRTKHQDI
jgi:hypothetical protein